MDLSERIKDVEDRITSACKRCGRNREDVRIVAVTKYVSLSLTEQIVEAGFHHVGENRWQDAKAKWEALSDRVTWHFIGHLQTNKVKDVVGKFAYIHSVDRLNLAAEISRKAMEFGVVARIFLQVNVSGEDTKYGVAPEGLFELAESVKSLPGIEVLGLMTMAPHENDPERTRPVFRRLRELRDELNDAKLFPYPLVELSMGMSNDFEVAIEEGATWVRLGSVLLPYEG
ncbi:YggS family pyridoxal phosphate-dependent enzyme [Gorillibacterium massiliense]|uniref:YggS family pyridoxal phosphate-dependent enzyme n=1 Tax=Gorillibacterium massiliense TaxID=1280390 RepID=UPI0004B9D35D|nr:YggS family pyridoxal phosphate-dependent enzyme [Gorillibacterium massiliense]